jgi:hypothetical protein
MTTGLTFTLRAVTLAGWSASQSSQWPRKQRARVRHFVGHTAVWQSLQSNAPLTDWAYVDRESPYAEELPHFRSRFRSELCVSRLGRFQD